MGEWNEVILEDVVSVLGDGLHGTPNYDDNGDYYFINGNNLSDGKIIIKDSTKRANKIEYEKYKKDLNDRTILVSINGTIGNVALYNNEKCILGKSACYFNVVQEVDKHFIKYVVTNKNFQEYIHNFANGTTIKNVSLNTMREYPFLLPPLQEQQTISSILSCLDDKIDLLHRQNKTLEELAETLFRQWFVEEADENWEVKSLYDLMEIVGGGTPKTGIPEYWDGEINWMSGKDITANHKQFILTTEKNITSEGLKNSSTKILPKFSSVVSARGTVGKICILSSPMAFSQTNYGVLPKIKNCFFFTYLLLSYSIEELQSASYGSVFDTITTNTFKEHKINIPEGSEIIKFEETVSSLFNKMSSNTNQIGTLTQLRDILLPKLMSGEVRVRF